MTRWYTEKKHEHFYKQAKQNGYRARSAYKLKQIQKKYNIINKNDTVIDLGAAPGGWSQIAQQLTGDKGRVVGVDILPIKPIPGIIFIQGDMTQDETLELIKQQIPKQKADVVISDMSPDISGNYDVDQARSIYLCEKALQTARVFLKNGGCFLCKVFEGADLEDFILLVKNYFKSVKRYSPPASRKSSSEIYIIGKNFRKSYLLQ